MSYDDIAAPYMDTERDEASHMRYFDGHGDDKPSRGERDDENSPVNALLASAIMRCGDVSGDDAWALARAKAEAANVKREREAGQ
jgi:hypothetical protein